MSASLLITRISDALAAGSLKQVPDSAAFATVTTMADLLRPWEEMFPGVERYGDDDARDIFSRGGGLREPILTARLRTSRRPLPPPRPIAASPKTISPVLFASIQAIWDYYQLHHLADALILKNAFTETGIYKFVGPLELHVSGYWPLGTPLEMICDECEPRELYGIHLQLPFYTYDCEESGVVEAFLSDIESVASCLDAVYDSANCLDKDNELITQVGIMPLVKNYELYRGAKTVNFDKLLYGGLDVIFGPVTERYPVHMKHGQPIISGDHGQDCEIIITSREDIEFCLDYAKAWYEMTSCLPEPYDLAINAGGMADELIHEICNVWRKTNNKRPIKWTSPLRIRENVQIRIQS
jgi:hypothetical protein